MGADDIGRMAQVDAGDTLRTQAAGQMVDCDYAKILQIRVADDGMLAVAIVSAVNNTGLYKTITISQARGLAQALERSIAQAAGHAPLPFRIIQ